MKGGKGDYLKGKANEGGVGINMRGKLEGLKSTGESGAVASLGENQRQKGRKEGEELLGKNTKRKTRKG